MITKGETVQAACGKFPLQMASFPLVEKTETIGWHILAHN